ncbi:hypothetical protein ZHAS_00010850 [Anopheles sinensis]|uniref:Uncharacterized protein n=1 Tax=Anopheles sinensis TaxID=74873 RepID=A0A084VYD1_ANOSI|nr:hypothetical protein ZHAS_00010850 [Anopheles sinensis]
MAFRRASYCCLVLLLLLYLAAALEAAGTNVGPQPPVRGRASNPSPRLPRTSASQLSAQNNATMTRGATSKNVTSSSSGASVAGSQATTQGRGNYRTSYRSSARVWRVGVDKASTHAAQIIVNYCGSLSVCPTV